MTEFTVSVMTTQPDDGRCTHCGEKVLLFNAHCFAEVDRPVITACKPCIIQRAGAPENVYVKTNTTGGLRETWKRNARASQPAGLSKFNRIKSGGIERPKSASQPISGASGLIL